ncbi:molybdopterin-dependent oxidoreductase [Nocardia arthritidis]|uniref:Molybdopterin-dependent oxidoreductase n=1 Tax=Nocardia arthritidis TaxID=228602 RepID=A0A6G9YPV9_9NOCA|nr:molybdopterin-dependent oxidoreductase [Nocardia arthritidis]QIS15335.1 molybdopterin-dependent oxidoreductase [Nocardia arthritidis]
MAELRLRVLAGLVSAGLTLGIAELLSALFGPDSEPLNVLGRTVVDGTPVGLREWAISSFGTNDKTVLYLSMAVVAVLAAGLIGAIERTTRAAGTILLVAFGLVTALFAANRAGLSAALPIVIGVIAGSYALRAITTRIDAAAEAAQNASATPASAQPTGNDSATTESADHDQPPTGVESAAHDAATSQTSTAMSSSAEPEEATERGDTEQPTSPARQTPSPTTSSAEINQTGGTDGTARPAAGPGASDTSVERRKILRGIGITAAIALTAGVGGRVFAAARRNVSGERAAVQLPTPSGPPAPIDPNSDLRVPGLTPYLTANSDFYRIDTALLVPQVSVDDWSLRIHGLVDREIRYSWADLAKRQPIERLVTLTCVSNPVGGDLIGNARWLGYRLDEMLAEAGVHPDADMVLSHSVDGFTAGSPLAALTDGRDAILAVGMNGEPLPIEHGYPARLVVPGLYGYVSATKWVTELEITRFDRASAYWTKRGWSANGPIKTGTRIDTPGSRARLKSGRVQVAGVSWAQHRGIRAVEVQIDDGDWQQARLAADQSIDTWRQWVFDWDATPGAHTIRARATDATGQPQTAARADVIPDGATGYPSITVQVS